MPCTSRASGRLLNFIDSMSGPVTMKSPRTTRMVNVVIALLCPSLPPPRAGTELIEFRSIQGQVIKNALTILITSRTALYALFPLRAVHADPGKINMASSGIGSGPHMMGELFKMMAGVDLLHAPYRGAGAALTDLIAGQVQVMFSSSSIGHIRDSKLRALAVTTAMRSEMLPDIPAMGEFVPGYEASGFFGLGAPKHTAAETGDHGLNQSPAAWFARYIDHSTRAITRAGLPSAPFIFNGRAIRTNLFGPICERLVMNWINGMPFLISAR